MEARQDEIKQQRKKDDVLLHAASKGLLQDVKELVGRGASPNSLDKDAISALHLGASRGYSDIVRYLASRGADVDAESRRGRTPLHYAAASGAEEVITFLLARDAWMEASDDADDTAFSLACQFAPISTVELMLKYKPNLSARNRRSLEPLGEAVARGRVDVARALLGAGADARDRPRGFTLLHIAAGMGQVDMIELLVKEAGLKVEDASNPERLTALHAAAAVGCKGAVDTLLALESPAGGGGGAACMEDAEGRVPAEAVPGGGGDTASAIKATLTRASRGARIPAPRAATGRAPAQGAGVKGGKHASSPSPSPPSSSYPPPPSASPRGKGTGGEGEGEEEAAEDMMAQVAASWASMSLADLGAAGVHPEVGKRAREWRKFRDMAEFHGVLAALRADAAFQEDFTDPRVFAAVEAVHADYNAVGRHAGDAQVMRVLNRLRMLNQVGREKKMKVVWEDLRAKPGGADADARKAFQLEGCIRVSYAAMEAAACCAPGTPAGEVEAAAAAAARTAAEKYLPLSTAQAQKQREDEEGREGRREGAGPDGEGAAGAGGGSAGSAGAGAGAGAGASDTAPPPGGWKEELKEELRDRFRSLGMQLSVLLLMFTIVAVLRKTGYVHDNWPFKEGAAGPFRATPRAGRPADTADAKLWVPSDEF